MAKTIPGTMNFSGTLGELVSVNRTSCRYVRRKRGTIKKAVLNEAFKQSVKRNKIALATAEPVNNIVKSYVGLFRSGKFWHQLLSRIKRCPDDKLDTHLKSLANLEVNYLHPLGSMVVLTPYSIVTYKDHFTVNLRCRSHPAFRVTSTNNCYFYELIVILWNNKQSISTHHSISTEWVYHEDEVPEYDIDFKRTSTDKYYLLALNLTGGFNEKTENMMRDRGMMILGGGIL